MQFFAWLLLNNHIQCKENLFKKKITDDSTCEICSHGAETAAHIMFECPFAKIFWDLIKVQTSDITTAADIYKLARPSHIPATHFDVFIILCCWLLWKRRNDFIFQRQVTSMRQLVSQCKTEAQLWSHRLPAQSRNVASVWCSIFTAALEQNNGASQVGM